MRARIVRTDSGFYVGEVYGTWENLFLHTEETCWNCVTDECLTKFGAKYELKKWKEKRCPEEFEI